MTFRAMLSGACMLAAAAFATIPANAARMPKSTTACASTAGQPTAASRDWNFSGEANSIFTDLQSDARLARYHADRLQSLTENPDIDWQVEAIQLNSIKNEINDMGGKLCRLETIRSAVAPWQQAEIDRIAAEARLMADSTQDAIVFGGSHQMDLWLATYKQYSDHLYNQARTLDLSVRKAVAFANVGREYRTLRRDMETQPSE